MRYTGKLQSFPAIGVRHVGSLLALIAAGAAPSYALDFWTAGSGEWTNSANWIAQPYPSGVGATALFEANLNPTLITVAAPVTLGSLILENSANYEFDALGTGSFIFSSASGTASLVTTPSVAASTLTLPMNLASNLTVTNQSAAPLIFTGALSGPGAFTFSGTGAIALRASANARGFIDGTSSGAISMNGGTLFVERVSTSPLAMSNGTLLLDYTTGIYTGAISLSNSTMQVNTAASAVLGQTLTLSGNVTLAETNIAPIATLTVPGLSGSGTMTVFAPLPAGSTGLTLHVTGTMNYSGEQFLLGPAHFSTINSSGGIALYNPTNTLIDSAIAHQGAVFDHVGTLTINGNSSSITNFALEGGVLAGTATLQLSQLVLSSGSLTYAGALTGLTHIDKISSSKVIMRNLGTSLTPYSGAINVVAGELQLINDNPDTGFFFQSSNPINVYSGATLTLWGGTYASPIHLLPAAGSNLPGIIVSFNGATTTFNGSVDLGTAGGILAPLPLTGGATFNGIVSGGPLTVLPLMILNFNSTANSFAALNVLGSTLQVSSTLSLVPVHLQAASTMIINYVGSSNPDRVPDSLPLTMSGSMIELAATQQAGVATSETLGTVSALRGVATFLAAAGTASTYETRLTIANLQRSPNVIIDFEDTISNAISATPALVPLGTTQVGPHIFLTGQADTPFVGGAYVYGLYANATTVSVDFVKYTAANGIARLTPADYSTAGESTWTNTTLADISGTTTTLTASRSVLAVKMSNTIISASAATLSLGSNTLNVQGGIILGNGSLITGTAGNHLTAGGSTAAELFLYSGGSASGSVTLAANITNNPGPDGQYDPVAGGPLDADNGIVSVTIAGSQPFYVSGNNTYTGTTYLTRPENGFIANTTTVYFTSAAAVPKGPFVIDDASILLNGTSGSFSATMGAITMRSGVISGSVITPASLALESGTFNATLAGSGPVTKTSIGTATLGSIQGFTGSIDVQGGVLSLPNFAGTLTNTVSVAGGTLVLAGSAVCSGAMTLGTDSTLYLKGFPTWKPSTLTLGTNATIQMDPGSTIALGGATDSMVDSADPTRRLNLNTGALTITAGAKNLAQLSSGPITINAGASLTVDSFHATAATVTGALKIRAGGFAVSAAGALTIAGTSGNWSGSLDISDHTLVLQPGLGDLANRPQLLQQLQNQILSGWNNGNWQGNGITSSAAAADPSIHGLGLFDNQLLEHASAGNQILDESSVLVSYALLGDVNFDGRVDAADLAIIAGNWHKTENSWSAGDLNDDGFVDSLDVALVTSHWDSASPFTPLVAYSPSFSFTLITPEPASLAWLACGTALLLGKRRRRPAWV